MKPIFEKKFVLFFNSIQKKKVIARETIKEYSRNYSSLNAKGDKLSKT